jgi:hypothetical protein
MSRPNASAPKINPSVIPAFASAERPFELLDAVVLVVGEAPGGDVDEGRVEDNVEAFEVEIAELIKKEIAVESLANVVAAAA